MRCPLACPVALPPRFLSSVLIGVLPVIVFAAAPVPPVAPVALQPADSLVALVQQVRPGFLIGSMSGGLDFSKPENPALADFFVRNFNIITVGTYMTSTQRQPGRYDFDRMDALIGFAEQHRLQVYLHPLIGGAQYTPKWVNEGGHSAEALLAILRDRITTILTRYRGRVHYVDVVNESLTGSGRRPDGAWDWQQRAYRGPEHVWMQTLGMYQGNKHAFPRYLVEAFRVARAAGGPAVQLILNEWGNETTKSPRAAAFLELMLALREEGIPVDAAGLQLHLRIKSGRLLRWASSEAFDYDAFSEQLARYAQAGLDVHLTEFDIHLDPAPTARDFELQGEAYAEVLRRALQSPAVKSFKTWGFTDRHSWREEGRDGRPLLLDEQLQPKPAYLRQLEMLRTLAGR